MMEIFFPIQVRARNQTIHHQLPSRPHHKNRQFRWFRHGFKLLTARNPRSISFNFSGVASPSLRPKLVRILTENMLVHVDCRRRHADDSPGRQMGPTDDWPLWWYESLEWKADAGLHAHGLFDHCLTVMLLIEQ